MEKRIRVLLSKPGCDGHWRGAVSVSRALRDSGMEVVFGGFQNIAEIVNGAVQEDVDVIGLSIHSGAHIQWTKQLVDSLEQKGLQTDFVLLVGGPIPLEDFEELRGIGAAGVFRPGTRTEEIVDCIKQNVQQKAN